MFELINYKTYLDTLVSINMIAMVNSKKYIITTKLISHLYFVLGKINK